MQFVEVFSCYAGRYLMHHRNAGQLVADAFEQMHDVATRNKEAMSIAELNEPLCKQIAVFFHEA